LNLGQLIKVLRSKYLIPAIGLNKIQGQPFKSSEIEKKVEEMMKGKS
jgi:2-oxoglutarate ferredoxin oxidoreductase subunit alpha